jgi:hypothetical protein
MRLALALSCATLLLSCGKRDGLSSDKVAVIARGTAYAESDYKIPGKVVILKFTADW